MKDAPMTLDQIPGFEGQGYMLVRKGIVLHYQHGPGGVTGMLVATNWSAAKKLRKGIPGASIAVVGSIPGETLEGQMNAAMEVEGCDGVFVSQDGETLQFFSPAVV
jgi:hypothetical protein